MDITTTNKKLYTTKLCNGETVNYAACFLAVSFIFIVLKQLLKTAFSISSSISVLISFAISAVILFILEKKYVFNHSQRGTLKKQIALYLFNLVVDFGFYKIADFIFGSVLGKDAALIFLISGFAFFFFNFYFNRLLVFDCTENAIDNKNGRLYRIFFNNRFIILSMALAILCLVFVFLVSGLFPFGNLTVMRMDLYHQYGPLFCEFYDRVTQHKSFIYSWEAGGGSSFLGNYFNYLSSPLSFIVFLFDRKEMAFAITTLVAVKSVLSALTFSIYLKFSQKGHSYAGAAFGVFYAFCGYFLAYYWNIMWIDGMILLPLIVLGIERIIDKNKPLCYIISLTVLLFSSYYMGYMACIFSVIYFLAYFLLTSKPQKSSKLPPRKKYSIKRLMQNRFINRGVSFAVSSLLCGALCAVTLIPVYFILQASSATSDSFPSTFESYFDLFNLISSHLAGLETTIRSSGNDVLPNIYCSILSVILLPLYFLNKEIRLKEKAVYLLLLVFFIFSFDCNFANFIWHGFHFPNDLPYRFSFMYSFLVLIIAFRSIKHIKGIQYRDIALTGMLWLFAAVLFEKFPTERFTEGTVYISIAFIILWTGVLLLIKKGNLTKLLAGITVIAIAFCEVIIADTASYVFTQNQDDYVVNYDAYEEAIDYTYNKDKDFYRTELCYLDTRMDPCLYGYRGMSIFSSMAYEQYSRNQYSLGMFGNRINSYTYNTQTPVYNMMYGIKYLMHTSQSLEPSSDFYKKFYTSENSETTVYKNDYFLPVAFETSSDIKNWVNEEGNPFEVQEDFIDNAAGVGSVFLPAEYVSTECELAECDDVSDNGTYFFTKDNPDSEDGNIDITIRAVNNSNLYIYLTSPVIQNINYYWNNDEDSRYQNIEEPYILDLGKHKKGDEIRISLSLSSIENDSSYFEIYAYNINKEVFDSAYELLSLGGLEITSYSDTKIEGNINAGYDGYLYTSIPYDEGWSVYIDGQKVKTFEIGGCQLATTIKRGEHKVIYRYTPKGLKYGLIITGAAWLCVIAFLIFKNRKKKRFVENE